MAKRMALWHYKFLGKRESPEIEAISPSPWSACLCMGSGASVLSWPSRGGLPCFRLRLPEGSHFDFYVIAEEWADWLLAIRDEPDAEPPAGAQFILLRIQGRGDSWVQVGSKRHLRRRQPQLQG